MSNEQYLIVSYFVIGAACAGLACATFLTLRRSLIALTNTAPGGGLGRILRSLFLLGLVLPAMAGFFSVVYRSCDRSTYRAIIADRVYLVAKNREQLSASFSHLAVALLVWGLILAVAILVAGRKKKASG